MSEAVNLLLKVEDQDTKNSVQVLLNFYNDENHRGNFVRACESLYHAMAQLGVLKSKGDTNMTTEKKEEQKQDLTWQTPEETDTLAKAERPADDFMDTNELDRDSHGKKKS